MRGKTIQRLDEQGFILVTAMMILVVLTFIGLLATQSTITELAVSGNDKVHKQTFYQADGGTELAQHLVYHNSICTSTMGGFTDDGGGTSLINGAIRVLDLTFSLSNPATVTDLSDTNREAVYYPDAYLDAANAADTSPHTNFLTSSISQLNPGAGLQMISGYEGLGAGAAGGGTSRLHTIASQHHGLSNSQSLIQVRWRLDNFVVTSAAPSDCEY